MVGRGGGCNDAVMDAGMRNLSRFPVKSPTHQPDSSARSPGANSCLHVHTHTRVRTVRT